MGETRAVRLPKPEPGSFPEGHDADVMSYWHNGQHWVLHLPPDSLANLSAHDVIEHSDGTITVSPSIKVTNTQGLHRHGYLHLGVWQPCADDRPEATGAPST